MAMNNNGGFSFENCARNIALGVEGVPPPRFVSTGTTTVAVTFKDGVVMGADMRATAGPIIASKQCEKVNKLTDSIYACGAGTAADIHQVARMLSSNLKLIELNTGRKAHVFTAVRKARQHLFRYNGYVGAYMLIGGVDQTGVHLLEVHAHGSSNNKPFASDGSGSYAAISVLERNFKLNMDEQEAIALTRNALEAGMHRDNMSGNALKMTVIKRDSTVCLGPIVPSFSQMTEPLDKLYAFRPGTTQVLKQKNFAYDVIESMDIEQ